MSLSFLQPLGFTQNEIDLYELLLRLGEVPASVLIKESKLKRPTVYKTLYSLQKKGLVSQKEIQKKINFRPESPTKLLELVENQFTTLERAKDDVRSVIPQLTSSYILSTEKPVIRMYEGREGIEKANLEILAEKKEILAYVKINPQIDKVMEKFWKKYYKTRIKDQIFVRSITPNTKEGIEYKKSDQEQLRITRLVPLEKFPINIEKNIVGNKVAFFSTQQGKLIATIIENQEIADAERAIFELSWQGAEHYDSLLSK